SASVKTELARLIAPPAAASTQPADVQAKFAELLPYLADTPLGRQMLLSYINSLGKNPPQIDAVLRWSIETFPDTAMGEMAAERLLSSLPRPGAQELAARIV